jgi:hypothetical protein
MRALPKILPLILSYSRDQVFTAVRQHNVVAETQRNRANILLSYTLKPLSLRGHVPVFDLAWPTDTEILCDEMELLSVLASSRPHTAALSEAEILKELLTELGEIQVKLSPERTQLVPENIDTLTASFISMLAYKVPDAAIPVQLIGDAINTAWFQGLIREMDIMFSPAFIETDRPLLHAMSVSQAAFAYLDIDGVCQIIFVSKRNLGCQVLKERLSDNWICVNDELYKEVLACRKKQTLALNSIKPEDPKGSDEAGSVLGDVPQEFDDIIDQIQNLCLSKMCI